MSAISQGPVHMQDPSRIKTKTLAILSYHKIGEPSLTAWRSWFYVPLQAFKLQMQWLRDNNWQVISMEAFTTALADLALFPAKSALITFDDGYRSVLENAAPVLQQFAYPAVLFIPTDYVGQTNRFDQGAEPEEPICSWQDLRDLEQTGVSIQSHSSSHRRFSYLSEEQQLSELRSSKELLEGKLGKQIALFAFPYGDQGSDLERVQNMLRHAGYSAAFTYGGASIPLPITGNLVEKYRLPRLAMGANIKMSAAMATS